MHAKAPSDIREGAFAVPGETQSTPRAGTDHEDDVPSGTVSAQRRSLVLLPLSTLLLSGCALGATDSASSTAPALPPTPDSPAVTSLNTQAAPGATAARDRSFGIVVPQGWKNETARHPTTVLYLKAPTPTENVYASFSIVKSVLPEPPPLEDLVNQGMIAQRQKGATVTKVSLRSVGGAPASGYRIDRVSDGHKIAQTQYYVVNGKQILVTTMTAAASTKTQADQTQDAILSSWSWGAPPATPSE